MKIGFVLLALTWTSLWFYPDQQGQRLYRKGEYEAAAKSFRDANWKGVAEYRAGNHEAAAQSFARITSPEGHYNQGNALVFQGKYEQAVASYDLALAKRPNWQEAIENREIARIRAERLETEGGNMTEGQLEPDEIVFDQNKKQNQDSEDAEETASQQMSDAEIQALWLNQVQTRPADFLRVKFAYQAGQNNESSEP